MLRQRTLRQATAEIAPTPFAPAKALTRSRTSPARSPKLSGFYASNTPRLSRDGSRLLVKASLVAKTAQEFPGGDAAGRSGRRAAVEGEGAWHLPQDPSVFWRLTRGAQVCAGRERSGPVSSDAAPSARHRISLSSARSAPVCPPTGRLACRTAPDPAGGRFFCTSLPANASRGLRGVPPLRSRAAVRGR